MANNAITKISKRAKQIQKKHPGYAWRTCIEKSSAEYRAGKLGARKPAKKKAAKRKPAKRKPVKKVKYRQTGSSSKLQDSQRSARTPGKRKSRSGNAYYEYRKNRSDMPGKMTGTALNEMVLRNLGERNRNLIDGESRLISLQKHYKNLPKGTAKSMIKRQINDAKKYIRTIKQEIRILKTNIK